MEPDELLNSLNVQTIFIFVFKVGICLSFVVFWDSMAEFTSTCNSPLLAICISKWVSMREINDSICCDRAYKNIITESFHRIA
ncbi:hypothetical protein RSAG8_13526, partial [Rhizoctonia solani AG-8 WAC10335]